MIHRLSLQSIRAYERAQVNLFPGINVFLGSNGNGKTTILEAAYLLGTVRSFRTTKLGELIRIGEEGGSVEGEVGEPKQRYRVELAPRRRRLFRDGKKISSRAGFTPALTMVALAPDHQEIIVGSGAERRRYLDLTLNTLQGDFLGVAQRYRKALRQKQALLRQELPFLVYEDQVMPWDEEMVLWGEKIRTRRRELTKQLQPNVEAYYQQLASNHEKIGLSYQESEKPLAEDLQKQRAREHCAKRALCGPQRDDLLIHLREQPARTIVSQGEKASLLLALKLAELKEVERVQKEKAILILDDIGVTLDSARREELFKLLAASPHQALISTPEREISRVANAAGARTLSRLPNHSPAGFSIACWSAT